MEHTFGRHLWKSKLVASKLSLIIPNCSLLAASSITSDLLSFHIASLLSARVFRSAHHPGSFMQIGLSRRWYLMCQCFLSSVRYTAASFCPDYLLFAAN